jgi:hypothetical protein
MYIWYVHKNINKSMTTNYQAVLTLLDDYSNISSLPESDISEMVSKSLRLNRLKANCQMWIDENPDCYRYLKIIPGLRCRFVSAKTKQIFRSSLITLFDLSVLLSVLYSIFSVFPSMGDGKILVTVVLSLGYVAWLAVIWTRRCAQ